MEEGRLEMIEAKAGAVIDLGEYSYSPYVVIRLAQDTLDLAEEVRRLNGRLEAVCDVVNNAVAFGDSPEPGRIMVAVRGE